MKITWLLLGLLFAISITLAITLTIPQSDEQKAFTHLEFETMLQSPDGVTRHQRIICLGGIFGVLQFCFFAGLYAFSVNKQGRLKTFKMPLLLGLLLNIAVFCFLVFAYWNYAQNPILRLVGSFPLPTALMFYGIWPAQVIFTIIYVLYFDRAIFTKEDQEKFDALVNSRRQLAGEGN